MREVRAQIIDEGAAARAPVVLVQLHALQKHECAKDFGVANWRSVFLREFLAQTFHGFLHSLMDAGGDQIGGPRFVVQTALQRAVGADERFKRFADIGIDSARSGE